MAPAPSPDTRPLLSLLPLLRVKKIKTGLSFPVRRLLSRGTVIRPAPLGAERGGSARTRFTGRSSAQWSRPHRRPLQGVRGRWPQLGPRRASVSGSVPRVRVRGFFGSWRLQWLRSLRTAAAARALAAAAAA